MTDIRRYLALSRDARAFAETLTVGARVFTHTAFTSPIGAQFQPGDAFVVDAIGPVNLRLRAELCGSVVWLAGGVFVTDACGNARDGAGLAVPCVIALRILTGPVE